TSDAERFVKFGISALGEADYETAASAATVAIALDDGQLEAWLVLGAARALQNRAAAPVQAYRPALARDERCLRAWVDLAQAYLLALDYAQAAEAVKQAIALDPEAKTPAGLRAQMIVVELLSAGGE